jgi:multisubunit Na+/H+ antiporter MnhC subunit
MRLSKECEMDREPPHKQQLFISHASGDKKEYVDPLAQALIGQRVSFG